MATNYGINTVGVQDWLWATEGITIKAYLPDAPTRQISYETAPDETGEQGLTKDNFEEALRKVSRRKISSTER